MQKAEIKLDYFAIWANAANFEKEIIDIIESKFEISRIVRRKFGLIFFFKLLKLYKFSFVPIYLD